MIAIIDYGAGNIFSVKNALDYLGLAGELTSDPEAIRKADALILPGVGAFPSAMQMLHDSGLTNIIQEEAHKKPFLGICLGMQLIFDESQKESSNEIWINLYPLTMLWEKHKSEVYRVDETKEYYRKYNIRIPGIND